MYVYLRYGKHIKRFQDVELVDCVEPQVDGITVEGTDPAVWFKVLFMDSILVDYDDREVYWNKETVVEATDIHWTQDDDLSVENVLPFYQNKGKMFNGGCYDFDVCVDELFDTARLITDEAADTGDEKQEEVLKQSLLRLLHVFILPKIMLNTNDLKDLKSILTTVERHQKDLETIIANKDKQRNSAEKSLEKQRRHLLTQQEFSSENFVSSCNNEFLKEFLKHLQNDVLSANKQFVEFDETIRPLRNSQTESDLVTLKAIRDKRETTFTVLNEAVMARETIKNVIVRKKHINNDEMLESKETAVHPKHMIYMETACRYQNVSDELKKLSDKLHGLQTVKKAIIKTMSEIDGHGQSTGHQPAVIEPRQRRESVSDDWLSLSNKVDNLISAKPLGFKNKHKKFCKTTITKCQKLFEGSKLSSSCKPQGKDKKCEVGRNMNLSDAIMHEYGNKPNVAVETISKEIIQHTSDMAESLAVEMFKRPVSEIRPSVLENIYICYEIHVSKDLMPVLHQLYENSYKQQCESLSRWISQKKLSDSLIEKVDPNQEQSESNEKKDGALIHTSTSPLDIICNHAFEKFESLVKSETDSMSIFTKLRDIMEIVQFVEKSARDVSDKSNPVCTDDILDVIILLLQRLDSELFLKMYAHINMLRHLSPDFVEGNCHEYALISFYAAYQHLFDTHVLDKASKKNVGDYSKVS